MDKLSFTNEYDDMLDFVRELQESAKNQSDCLLAEIKEWEYKRRQQEFVIREHEKKKIPNISMFSPLSVEESEEEDILSEDYMEEILTNLKNTQEKWEKQKKINQSFVRLNDFISELQYSTSHNFSKSENTSIDYSTKLLETQEMDRNRISRDLHDSTVQSLTSLGHKMEYCSKLVDKDPVKVKLELQSMIELNKEIINDMREIIYDLRPMSLSNIGLVSTIEAYCLHIRRNDNMDAVFKVEGEEYELSSIVSVTLYRIIQEACNNAIRHSKAKKIYVKLSFKDNFIVIDVEDNGIGFDIYKVEQRSKEDFLHGFGLSTMKERAKLLSGTFSIDTKPECGTRIHVSVPVKTTSRKEEKSYE